ncbi:MAG: dipeptidyl-peptidase 3 family protein [Candidatus Krumholzibacteriia bacterium]
MNSVLPRLCGPLAALLLFAPPAGSAEPAGSVALAPDDCGWVGSGVPTVVPDLAARLAAYAPTEITAEVGHLPPAELAALHKLIAAARIMDDLFYTQACPCRAGIAARADLLTGPLAEPLQAYLTLNAGPWDRRLDRAPFMGGWPHPAGANFYPLDLTEAEKGRIQAGEAGLNGLQSMVRRDRAGQLVAVPYGQFFREPLQRCATLLREAAALTENASLRLFLAARAEALLTDDTYRSDLLWMDLDSPVEITIGPYETYEDGLFGFKAAFEAFVTVVDPAESERLASFKQELPWLESQLPIPDAYKNPNRGAESPIRVVDEVFSAGDTRVGIQTIAFNLPNDERVREAKGSKKVLLRNVMNAKFTQILTPIAQELIAPDQLGDLSAEAFFLHTLWHEMSHGLGPGRIVRDGRPTEVRLELKETYSTIEEAKADLMGTWDVYKLQGKGLFTPAHLDRQAVTYLAGLFRSVRFGIAEAHGQANAIQFNFLRERGVIGFDAASGRFRIDKTKYWGAVEELLRQILVLQAEGDHAAAQEMIRRYAVLPPELATALARLDRVPVDIRPRYTLATQ